MRTRSAPKTPLRPKIGLATPASPRLIAITFESTPNATSGAALANSTNVQLGHATDLQHATAAALSSVIHQRHHEVFVAYGPYEDGRRFDREGIEIRKTLRFAPVTVIERPAATPEAIEADALRRPFAFHLAVERQYGTTRLADVDGRPLPLSDEHLVECLAPIAGHPALIVVTGCNSRELLPLLRVRMIGAFIGFDDPISEEDALMFAGELYGRLVLGDTIAAAGEHMVAWMRRRRRPVPFIYAPEPWGSLRLG